MGIVTPKLRSIDEFFVEVIRILNEEIQRTLAYTCEEAVGKIRDRSSEESWIDDTGNLRSSIGYGIYEYGRTVLESAFPVVKEGTEGAAKGREAVNDLAGLYSKAYSAVVIAAMSYAQYVEAKKNKDVLGNTYIWAKSVIEQRLQRAVEKAELRVQSLKITL